MNKNRSTLGRISWTTESLNFFMEIAHDIAGLREKKDSNDITFIKGTKEDVSMIENMLTAKIGDLNIQLLARRPKVTQYSTRYLYNWNKSVDVTEQTPPSDLLEAAFSRVADTYIEHQESWDDASRVILDYSSDEEDSDMEEEEFD